MGNDNQPVMPPPQFPAWFSNILGGAGAATISANQQLQQTMSNQLQGMQQNVQQLAVPLPAPKPTIEVAPEVGKRHILKGEV